MTIILRLDPALPVLWRSPDAVQFGVSAVAVLSPVEAWQLRLISELTAGLPESAVMVWAEILGVSPSRVRTFIADLSPALLRVDPDLPARVPRVRLHSDRPAHDAHMLATLRGVCGDAGIEVVGLAPGTGRDPALVIVLAHHTVAPRTSAALLADEVAQLPVVVTANGVRIGPVIVPGQTACLHCAELHRIDHDPGWPTVATQLLELVAPVPSPLVALEAAVITARFVKAAVFGTDAAQLAGASVSLRAADARREWARHRPHPSCGCLSLAQSATLPGARDRQSAKTRATAMRVPA